LSYNDYDNDNSNSNVSSRLSKKFIGVDRGDSPKNKSKMTGRWYFTGRRPIKAKEKMKRIGNLYERICSIENLKLADQKARKGKAGQYGVRTHDMRKEANIQALHEMLVNKTYTTSQYSTFRIYDPKEREIFKLPYYPDRITHHAIMNVMEPIFISTFTADTYSCIRKRGIHAAERSLKKALTDVEGTRYCLKLDIRKFYPSIDHQVLKSLIRKKIKDADLLWLMDNIIDSTSGVPIGNYLSQYFANFYLAYFDHWIKEEKGVRYYFRYADDLVILSGNKPELHALLSEIRTYLSDNLKLQIKGNYQIFPVESRSIDFVGYRFYHTHTLLRKSIKQRFARKVHKGAGHQTLAAYYGWAKHCDSKNLLKKLSIMSQTKFSTLGIKPQNKAFEGEKMKIERAINKTITVHEYRIVPSKFPEKGNGKRLDMQIAIDGVKRVVWTGSNTLMEMITQVPQSAFPFEAQIVKENDRYEFR
jgi:RNA-directed DNA polymerase